jgi:hypothetical protein
MQRLIEHRARPQIGRCLAVAAALLCATALSQPNLAYAGPHGGGGGFHGGGFGGFHGGGFHAGFGGFHGGGFHGGGFHGREFQGFHGGGFHGREFGRFRGGAFFGLGYPYGYGWDYYPDYGYDYGQPSTAWTWYYCSDPAGYYPYVAQCNTGWQTVPAN